MCRATSGSSAHTPLAKNANAAARTMIASSAGELRTNRAPATVAERTCSRGSVRTRAGTDTIATTPITARNDAALTKNTSAALVAASSSPPIAGPIARARFWLTDPSAIACGRSDGGTSSGWSVCAIGPVRPCPTPTPHSRISSTAGVTSPARSSAPSAAADASITACPAMISFLRLSRSPSTPPGTASSSTGRFVPWIAPTRNAELVSVVITHCAATVCIQLPTFEVSCASHHRRKSE